jgi:hypothetical protein
VKKSRIQPNPAEGGRQVPYNPFSTVTGPKLQDSSCWRKNVIVFGLTLRLTLNVSAFALACCVRFSSSNPLNFLFLCCKLLVGTSLKYSIDFLQEYSIAHWNYKLFFNSSLLQIHLIGTYFLLHFLKDSMINILLYQIFSHFHKFFFINFVEARKSSFRSRIHFNKIT